jgi:hypothetical protein
MERAASLGPWEPSIQLGIAEEGMPILDELPKDLQELVMATVTRGLQSELQSMIALAEEYGLIEPSAEEESAPTAGSTEYDTHDE